MPTYFAYILFSPRFGRSYAGQTNDLTDRLRRHNEGMVLSTKRYRPWELIYTEQFSNRREAMKREKWLKSGKGRELIEELVEKRRTD